MKGNLTTEAIFTFMRFYLWGVWSLNGLNLEFGSWNLNRFIENLFRGITNFHVKISNTAVQLTINSIESMKPLSTGQKLFRETLDISAKLKDSSSAIAYMIRTCAARKINFSETSSIHGT